MAGGVAAAEGLHDHVEQVGADDAAVPPQRGDGAQVQRPAVLLGGGGEHVHALRVGHELGGEQRLAHVLHERVRVLRGALRLLVDAGREGLTGDLAHRALRGQRAGEDGLGDRGHRGADVETRDRGPAAGALLPGLVHDHVHERAARGRVHLGEHLGRDLDEVGGQVGLVPRREHLGLLGGLEAAHAAQQVVGLADDLHVRVLDAVVDHLHVVAGAVRADPGAARLPLELRGDLLEHRAEGLVGLLRTAGHDRRTVQGTLLAAGDTDAHEVQALLGEGRLAAAGVLEMGVAGVDDDVALVQQGDELVDDGVHGGARLDHDEHPARHGEGLHELGERLRRHERALVTVLGHELVRAGPAAVVQGHRVAVAGEVAREVRAHHRQARDADVGGADGDGGGLLGHRGGLLWLGRWDGPCRTRTRPQPTSTAVSPPRRRGRGARSAGPGCRRPRGPCPRTRTGTGSSASR